MGYELRRMIRDGAPAKWTALMRLVAYEIADDARDPDPAEPLSSGRLPWSVIPVEGYRDRDGQWRDGLAEICGVTPRAISDALTELGRTGYEMRQPITDKDGKPVVDKRGRVVYAAKGHALRFVVPPLLPRPKPKSSHPRASNDSQRSHEGAANNAHSSHERAANDGDWSHRSASNNPQRSHPDGSKVARGCDPVPSGPQHQSPHQNQSPQSRSAALIRQVFSDATADEIRSIIDTKIEKGAHSLEAVIRTEITRGTLRLPCDSTAKTKHTEACRSGDRHLCAWSWCECRCHIKPATPDRDRAA